MTILEIQEEIHDWSRSNFGDNLTGTLDIHNTDDGDQVALGALAPLMGMVEELGEYTAAHSREDELDALGDQVIYFCDYCARMGMPVPLDPFQHPYDFGGGVQVSLGELTRCHLKRAQGIRGMDDPDFFKKAHDAAVIRLAGALHGACKAHGVTFHSILETTWTEVVRKRNWRKDPKAGGGHTH